MTNYDSNSLAKNWFNKAKPFDSYTAVFISGITQKYLAKYGKVRIMPLMKTAVQLSKRLALLNWSWLVNSNHSHVYTWPQGFFASTTADVKTCLKMALRDSSYCQEHLYYTLGNNQSTDE